MRIKKVSVCLTVLTILTGMAAEAATDELEKGFVQPPDSARPHTWWHWMNGNITKEGITADLEAMARVGVGGAQIFNAAEGIPHGTIQFNSPEWIGLVKHAAKEANRLGLELCIHNCAGWSSSGGPWNTPEHGMKVVVTSETQVKGPSAFNGKLAQPPTKLDFYRDIAVLAFRTPSGERIKMRDLSPKVTCSEAKQDAAKAMDGNNGTFVRLNLPKPKAPAFVQFEFAQPYTARMLSILPGAGMQGCSGKIEVSDDGQTFRAVESFSMQRGGELRTFAFAPVTAMFYRVLFTDASNKMKQLLIAEVDFSAKIGVENLVGKILRDRIDIKPETSSAVKPEEVVQGDKIVNLTAKMGTDGQLAWDVPEGDWTILRIGYTPNGRNNHPAPTEGTGLECDKLSKEAAQAHWDGSMGKVLAELGPLAGNVKSGLNNVLIDSYEVGTQNWTQNFKEEFQKRRGYDITRFLPIFTGRVVDSPEVTERFLWDLRRTICDLFAENYSGQFKEMAHRAGLIYSVEPYGNCPSDDLQYGSFCDIPMGEFWPASGASVNIGNAKLPASVAHVYGKKIVGAESFTAEPSAGKWLKDPFSIKAQGDAVYCGGVNRIIYHRYAHQPWTDPARLPGMTMGQWGTHFERTLTWWEQSKDWLKYQARCQYLLQSGQFVADVCFYCGEDAPNSLRGGGLPQGYDYDGCDTAALSLMSVKDGRIVLPSGMSYRLLVLPGEKTMSPAVLETIAKLVKAGATVVGPKPERSPGLSGYPACDAEVKRLADGLWSKGVRDQSPTEVLAAMNVKPDFVCTNKAARLNYIHRAANGTDYYFVASPKTAGDEVDCTFRVSGKVPELWHPDTGVIEKAPVYTEQDGCTTVTLRFDPAGSMFVVFRQPSVGDHAVAVRHTAVSEAKGPVAELTILKAEYGAFGEVSDLECVDVTTLVKQSVANGNRRVTAKNDLAGDPAPMTEKEMKLDYLVNNEKKSVRIDENRSFELPAGAEVIKAVYGLITEASEPQKQTVDVTAKLAALVKEGALAVQADNALAGGHDPAFMTVKELHVEYTYKGQRKEARVHENQMLMLPETSDQAMPLPTYELSAKKDGTIEVQAWKPGTVEIAMAAGKTLKAAVAAVPKPVEITGSWELSFPPKWGAPAKVTLDKLISWTEHPDSGVKYFSGTATYRKTFAWDAKKQKAERYILDLGDLQNFAEVELNGKALSLLWKPPYRLDVTDTLKSGQNTLQIKITNLWPNRLIGDEQLPEDREWDGKHLKAWPQWVLDGKPSPTGRFTFTTWHHWYKDDQPLRSGLFGPVMIWTVEKVTAL
jgi:hypothetical protein